MSTTRMLLHEVKTYLVLVIAITSLALSLVYVTWHAAQATLPQASTELFVPVGGGQGNVADYSDSKDPESRFAVQGYDGSR